MLQLVLVSLLSALVPLTAFSAPKKKRPTKKVERAETEDDDDESPDTDTVEGKRQSRPLVFNLNATPLSDFLFKYGASAGYRLGRKWEVYGLLLTGTEDFKSRMPEDPVIEATEAKGAAYLLTVNARYFVWNSFNLSLGGGYRRGVFNLGLLVKGSSKAVDAELKTHNIVVYSALGNHWTLGNGITLGADWLAVTIPVVKGYDFKRTSRGLTTAEEEDVDAVLGSLGDTLSGITALTLALVYVGYSF